MANEAVIIELGPDGGNPVTRTVASGTAITKGTLMVLYNPNTVLASSGATGIISTDPYAFGGIAAADKDANDFATTIACYIEGVYDIKCNAGNIITCGNAVAMSGANLIRMASASDLTSGGFVGYAEETAAVNDVIRVRLRGSY